MTLREYRLRMQGYALSFLDREYFAHLEAFSAMKVQATDEKGNLRYRVFSDFYNREKRKRELLGHKVEPKNNRLAQIARNVRAYRERKEVEG